MEKPKSESVNEFTYPKESTPENIQTYGAGEDLYDVYKLIAIAEALPEEMVSVTSLVEVLLNERVWTDTQSRTVSVGEVLRIIETNREERGGVVRWGGLQEEYPDLAYHFGRLQTVEYSTPILLLGENRVIDGIHRLLKAWVEGANEIKVKRFHELPRSALLPPELRARRKPPLPSEPE